MTAPFWATPEGHAYFTSQQTPFWATPEGHAFFTGQPAPPGTLDPAVFGSAQAELNKALAEFGLESLADFVWTEWKAGRPIEQIMLDIRNTPEYKTRFPAMATLAQGGHAITEQQYVDYERSAQNVMKQYGIPAGFYDQPDDFAGFLTNNISIAELADRVQLAADAVFNAPPLAKAQLQTLYGISEGAITAYMLDPTRAEPILQRTWNAARAGADWQQSQLGQLTTTQAEQLAILDPAAAAESIAKLGTARELFGGLDFGETDITRQTLLGSLTGNVANAQEIATRAERRQARFQGGTRYGQTQEGLTV